MFLLGMKISNRERMIPGIIMTHLHSDNTLWSVIFLLGVKISNRERMMHGVIMTSLHSDDTLWSV